MTSETTTGTTDGGTAIDSIPDVGKYKLKYANQLVDSVLDYIDKWLNLYKKNKQTPLSTKELLSAMCQTFVNNIQNREVYMGEILNSDIEDVFCNGQEDWFDSLDMGDYIKLINPFFYGIDYAIHQFFSVALGENMPWVSNHFGYHTLERSFSIICRELTTTLESPAFIRISSGVLEKYDVDLKALNLKYDRIYQELSQNFNL
jgi:hypothetical protein